MRSRSAFLGSGALQLALVLALIAVFSIPALQIHLWGDDFVHFQDAYELHERPGRAFEASNVFFRPLMLTSMYLSYKFFGTDSALYNLSTLVHHLVVVALLFLLLESVGSRRGVNFAVALLYGLTPLAAEATLWTVCRADVLIVAFTLALLLYLARCDNVLRPVPQLVMLLLFSAAMGSKESWVVLPAIAVLFLVLVKKESVKRALAATLAGWMLLVSYVAHFFAVPAAAGRVTPFDYSGGVSSVAAMVTKFGGLIWHYCTIGQAYGDPALQAVFGFVAFAAVAAVALWQRNRLALFGGGLLVLGLVPTAHLAVAPSRFNYLPLVGFWIAVVAVAEGLGERLVSARGVSPRVLAGLGSGLVAAVLVLQVVLMQGEILDYDRFGERHAMMVTAWQRVAGQVEHADTLVLVDLGTVDAPLEFARNARGLPKSIYPKPDDLWHVISFAGLVNFAGRPFVRRVKEVRPEEVSEPLIASSTVVVFRNSGFSLCPSCRADVLEVFRRSGHLPGRTRLYRVEAVGRS